MAKVGIDFGTTNSSLVAYDKKSGKFEFFGSKDEREKPTPSVVWYHDNHIEVGRKAKDNYNKCCGISGHHIETSIKSKLGQNKKVSIFGKPTEPHVVTTEILKHMKSVAIGQSARKSGINLDSAVFTVPVNFSGKQRADLRKAAQAAGIEVSTFIHEPFAALIGHMYSMGSAHGTHIQDNSYILVFDWGGGTLDITVVRVEHEKMFEVGTSELSGIAGDKFDEELAAVVRNRFIDRYASVFDPEYIRKMLDARQDQIITRSELCKIELSTKLETRFETSYIMYDEEKRIPYDIDEIISRSDFEACISRHIEAASNRIDAALRDADISYDQVSFVLMTGGTSNIPIVRAAIENKFSSRVYTAKMPEMVIAQGAAVVAEMGWSPYLSKNIMVELSDGSYWTAFPKGLPLVRERMPAKTESFTCVDTRDKEAKLIIAEGNVSRSETKRNLAVLNVPVENQQDLRLPDELSVDFSINRDIVLSVRAYGKFAGKRKSAEIHDICFGLERK